MIKRTLVVAGLSAASVLTGAAVFAHTAAERWHKQTARVFNSYRPELHYMRGLGPKWREKHGAQ